MSDWSDETLSEWSVESIKTDSEEEYFPEYTNYHNIIFNVRSWSETFSVGRVLKKCKLELNSDCDFKEIFYECPDKNCYYCERFGVDNVINLKDGDEFYSHDKGRLVVIQKENKECSFKVCFAYPVKKISNNDWRNAPIQDIVAQQHPVFYLRESLPQRKRDSEEFTPLSLVEENINKIRKIEEEFIFSDSLYTYQKGDYSFKIPYYKKCKFDLNGCNFKNIKYDYFDINGHFTEIELKDGDEFVPGGRIKFFKEDSNKCCFKVFYIFDESVYDF